MAVFIIRVGSGEGGGVGGGDDLGYSMDGQKNDEVTSTAW